MIKLGQEAKDKVTGFKGIIIGRSSWITGCDQYCLIMKIKAGNLPEDGQWFDEGRIEITGNGILPKEVKTEKNGGPRQDVPKAR